MRKIILIALLILTASVLSACMYPDDLRVENQIPAQDQLLAVQQALDKYKEDTGILPIKNRDMDTDIYIKYIIDFEKLVPKYLSQAPANSYEKGGLFQYVIWEPETKPTVKLIDLRMPEKIRDVKARTIVKKYPQYDQKIADHVYTINYKNLGFEEPLTVASPYTNNVLPLVVSTEGEIYVDYAQDLYLYLQENEIEVKEGDDLRQLLAEHYPVLPAYSLPYTIDENKEPTFMPPSKK